MSFRISKSLLASLLVTVALCLALVSIYIRVASDHAGALSNTSELAIEGEGKTSNAEILVVTTPTNPSIASAAIASVLRQHFSDIQVLNYSAIDINKVGKKDLPDALILVPDSNGLIPEDSRVLSIAEKVLEGGKLLVIADGVKPLNNLMLMNFLQKLSLNNATLNNIRSVMHEKEITVSNGVERTSIGEDIYVFALSLGNGKYPSIHILSADTGAKVIPTSIYDYITSAISNYLKNT